MSFFSADGRVQTINEGVTGETYMGRMAEAREIVALLALASPPRVGDTVIVKLEPSPLRQRLQSTIFLGLSSMVKGLMVREAPGIDVFLVSDEHGIVEGFRLRRYA